MSYVSNGWRADMQNVSAEIDEAFGEAVTLTPCERRPNFDPKPQPEHAVKLLAVFRWRAKFVLKTDIETFTGPKGLVESQEPIFEFSRDALPWALRQGDIITRVCSGEEFQIKSIQPDGVARIVTPCVQLGRSST